MACVRNAEKLTQRLKSQDARTARREIAPIAEKTGSILKGLEFASVVERIKLNRIKRSAMSASGKNQIITTQAKERMNKGNVTAIGRKIWLTVGE
ncbi:MAG: hypothetical protein K2H37_05355 [Lachnospiraceae bacterium]|nr:hypothetical protein [Lachnospiraceae bacterium]